MCDHSFTKYCGSWFPQCSALVGLNIQHTQRLVTLQSEVMDAKLEVGPGCLCSCLLWWDTCVTPGPTGVCAAHALFLFPTKGPRHLRHISTSRGEAEGPGWHRSWEAGAKHPRPPLSSFSRTTAIFLPLGAPSELLFLEKITTWVQMRFHAV